MAHSMGGLIGRSMLRQFGGAESVDHFITYGTPHHGSVLGHLVGFLFTAIKEMTPGSEFLTELNEQEELTPNIKRFAIKASFDELVIPHSSAEWRGAPVRTIETSAHLFLIDHPLAVKWGMEDLAQ
jgi:triacylglycerol lipase